MTAHAPDRLAANTADVSAFCRPLRALVVASLAIIGTACGDDTTDPIGPGTEGSAGEDDDVGEGDDDIDDGDDDADDGADDTTGSDDGGPPPEPLCEPVSYPLDFPMSGLFEPVRENDGIRLFGTPGGEFPVAQHIISGDVPGELGTLWEDVCPTYGAEGANFVNDSTFWVYRPYDSSSPDPNGWPATQVGMDIVPTPLPVVFFAHAFGGAITDSDDDCPHYYAHIFDTLAANGFVVIATTDSGNAGIKQRTLWCALDWAYNVWGERGHLGCDVTATDGSMSGGMTDDDTGTSTDDGMTGTTDGGGCMNDDDCVDPASPFCSGETCVPCSETIDPDASCASLDAATPLCIASQCVQCTAADDDACMGTTPLCDDDTNTCVACDAHDQCPGSAGCHMATGECLPADAVFYVDGGAACPGMGTQASPWCELQVHIAGLAASERATFHVAELGGIATYDEDVVVATSKVVAVLAEPGDVPRFSNDAAPNTLHVSGSDTAVYLDGLRFEGNLSAPAILVDDGRLWATRTQVVNNNGGGIVAQSGAELTLENCFVGQPADVVAVDVQSSTATIVYSTLATSTFGSTAALQCNAAATMTVRNSIIVNQGGTAGSELNCTLDDASGNATEAEAGAFPAMPTQWFVDYATGDFHLQNQGLTVFADIATWQTGDPFVDIDGDARPAVDGAADYAGADVP